MDNLAGASREQLVTIIIALQAQVAAQQRHIAAQALTIDTLTARIKELEDQRATDSHNSSKPPSSDRFGGRRTKSLRKPSGKLSGGQPGHPGSTLRQTEHPDQVVVQSPADCGGCGRSLAGVVAETIEKRQVVELPPLRLDVVEHQAERKRCPGCGRLNTGQFPAGVTQPVQYGPRLQGFLVYLMVYQLLPSERTQELVRDLFGQGPSEGTLHPAVQRCSGQLEGIETAIKRALQGAPVGHVDETGLYVGGRREWLHVFSTSRLTHYARHTKRGKVAPDEIGILPRFQGRAVHDGWKSYFQYACAHALCNAHHLRELTFLEEQQGQAWAGTLGALLGRMQATVVAARAAGRDQLEPPTIQALEAEYDRIVADALAACPSPPERAAGQRGRPKQSKAKNLLDRLSGQREEVLVFLHDFRVPFDNNQAERDLRMMKVQQKISGCFRSEAGAQAFCRIRGYLSTLRKQGLPILDALTQTMLGTPLTPSYATD